MFYEDEDDTTEIEYIDFGGIFPDDECHLEC